MLFVEAKVRDWFAEQKPPQKPKQSFNGILLEITTHIHSRMISYAARVCKWQVDTHIYTHPNTHTHTLKNNSQHRKGKAPPLHFHLCWWCKANVKIGSVASRPDRTSHAVSIVLLAAPTVVVLRRQSIPTIVVWLNNLSHSRWFACTLSLIGVAAAIAPRVSCPSFFSRTLFVPQYFV